jgi:hypothetical protein
LVVVDLAGRQRGDGMIGQGGLHSRLGPVECSLHSPGRSWTLCQSKIFRPTMLVSPLRNTLKCTAFGRP